MACCILVGKGDMLRRAGSVESLMNHSSAFRTSVLDQTSMYMAMSKLMRKVGRTPINLIGIQHGIALYVIHLLCRVYWSTYSLTACISFIWLYIFYGGTYQFT